MCSLYCVSSQTLTGYLQRDSCRDTRACTRCRPKIRCVANVLSILRYKQCLDPRPKLQENGIIARLSALLVFMWWACEMCLHCGTQSGSFLVFAMCSSLHWWRMSLGVPVCFTGGWKSCDVWNSGSRFRSWTTMGSTPRWRSLTVRTVGQEVYFSFDRYVLWKSEISKLVFKLVFRKGLWGVVFDRVLPGLFFVPVIHSLPSRQQRFKHFSISAGILEDVLF